MPDIAMCRGENCDRRKKCYRYMAVPFRFWQSYFSPKKRGKDCDNFYPIEEGAKIRED
jgi:hypothetical protein